MSSNQKYLVVTCDGGGIRGLISALLLQNLGSSLLDNVNMFAGTSTGSLIALGLGSQKLSIDDMVGIYESDCSQIFQSYVPTAAQTASLEKTRASLQSAASSSELGDIWTELLGILNELLFPPYSADALKSLLEQKLGTTTIGQVTGKHILAATFWLNASPNWQAVAMHNLPNLSEFGDFSQATLVDAALASAAAPTYFPPHQLSGSSNLFADGGVFANNPASLALAALQGSGVIGGANGVPLSNVYMLSVSTGSNQSSFPPNGPAFPYDGAPYGILGWLWPKQTSSTPNFPLLNALFDGSSQINSFQAAMTLGKNNYMRADPGLGRQIISLDDCGVVGSLKTIAGNYMKTQEWQNIVSWANANFS